MWNFPLRTLKRDPHGPALHPLFSSAKLLLKNEGPVLKEGELHNHIHHVHIFASDLDKSIKFYEEFFEGKVILDMEFEGARNVFMRVGNGRIHFYDQPPKASGRGSIHHFGIQTDNIVEVVSRMKSKGIFFKKDITDEGSWKYIMVPAPDDILIELFEVDKKRIPPEFLDYFE